MKTEISKENLVKSNSTSIDSKCKFAGHDILELIVKYESAIRRIESDVQISQQFLTPVSLKYNYADRFRSDQIKGLLTPHYNYLLDLRQKFIAACEPMYHEDVAIEWLSVYVEPVVEKIYTILNTITQSKWRSWRVRPLTIKLKTYSAEF